MARKVYDCFTFFNELDLLELRLAELNEVVDYFVLCESTVTFQGKPKELFYNVNKERFAQYHDKIIHLIVDDMPDSDDPWAREHFQRSAIRRVFDRPATDDIIIIGDADEIVSPITVQLLKKSSGYFQINMPMYQYYINLRHSENGWSKVFAFSFDLLDKIPDFNWIRTHQDEAFEMFPDYHFKLYNGGWHFTYLGGAERIRNKLSSFSHREEWFQKMLHEGGIEAHVAAGYVVGNEWHLATYCEIDNSFPTQIKDNLQKYINLGYIKNPYQALTEMQQIIRNCHVSIRSTHEKIKNFSYNSEEFFKSLGISTGNS